MQVHADGFQATQHQRGAVNVVDAPTSEPAAIGFLLVFDELESLLDHGMIPVISVSSQHLEDTPGNVHRRWIQHSVVIGKGNVLEDHAVVVLVE